MNGVFLVDKPQNMTSFDVVAILRRKLNLKRIGHTGTLDPNATGLMMMLVGKSTKILPFISDQVKTYHAGLKLGIKTDTGDIWGSIIEEKPVPVFNEHDLHVVLKSFLGKSDQLPPMYSAISVNGKRLYEYARQSIDVERKPREIEIFSIDGMLNETGIEFTVTCSSGTYVRTLCEMIAEKLGSVGTMSSLNRIRINDFKLEDSVPLNLIDPKNINWLALDSVIGLPIVETRMITDIKNGKQLVLDTMENKVLLRADDELLAVYERIADTNHYRCVRGLW